MSTTIKANYKKGLFSRKIDVDTILSLINEISKAQGFSALYRKVSEEDYIMQLIPCGIIGFHITEKNIAVEAGTSVAGPGFHIAVIKLLKKLGEELSIVFDYDDSSDYAYSGSVVALQNHMVEELKKDIQKAMNNRVEGSMALLNWEKPFLPLNQKPFVTLMGSFTFEEIEAYLNGDFAEFAKKYYLWYNEDQDALFHTQVALYHIWNDYKWAKAANESEKEIQLSIARHLEIARMIDNEIELPEKPWMQICSFNGIPYLNFNEFASLDLPNLGYLKHNVEYRLPLGYSLIAPGKFNCVAHEEQLILVDGERQIMATAVAEEGSEIRDPRLMLEHVDIQKEQNGYLYVGEFREEPTTNEETIHVLNAFIQGRDSFVNTLIYYKNTDEKEWALEVLNSFMVPVSEPLSFKDISKEGE